MNRSRNACPSRGQSGATLLVSMIFLVVLTLMVVSAVKVTNVNTKLVGNMQTEKEANAAAMQAIETTISTDFTAMPAASTTAVDINNSGQTGSTYTVAVPAPACTGIKPIKLSELDPSQTSDQPCYVSGASQNTGIAGSGAGGDSLCSNSNWEVNATATPPAGGAAAAATHQGIAVRVVVGAAC
jgi:Tfp pilus assembly protein PilX